MPGTIPTTLSPQLRSQMEAVLGSYLAEMEAQRPASYAHAYTVFLGVGGRALLLLKLHEASGNASFLEQATPYVMAMEQGMTRQARAS